MLLAHSKDKLYWERRSAELSYHAAFHGVKTRLGRFDPYAGEGGKRQTNVAAVQALAEKAKEKLPEDMDEEQERATLQEIMEREES